MTNAGAHTADSVAAILQRNIEPADAETVLTALAPLEGHFISVRMLDVLPGGRVEWRIHRQLGWTELKNRAYIRSGGTHPHAVCLVIARGEGARTLSTTFIERENPPYFSARRQRNALREKALANPDMLARIAAVMNQIEDVNRQRLVYEQQLRGLVDRTWPASPDTYELERACGLRAEAKR